MNIATILGVLKLALQVYRDERGDAKDRLVKKLNKLEKEFYEEMSRPDTERSDLFFDNLMLEFEQLGKELISKQDN
jgi:hypothetical protein